MIASCRSSAWTHWVVTGIINFVRGLRCSLTSTDSGVSGVDQFPCLLKSLIRMLMGHGAPWLPSLVTSISFSLDSLSCYARLNGQDFQKVHALSERKPELPDCASDGHPCKCCKSLVVVPCLFIVVFYYFLGTFEKCNFTWTLVAFAFHVIPSFVKFPRARTYTFQFRSNIFRLATSALVVRCYHEDPNFICTHAHIQSLRNHDRL